MKAGKLRQRINIQTNTPTKDADGVLTDVWATTYTVWGSIEPLAGREWFAAKQFNAEVNTKIRIRYLAGITAEMRITYGTQVFKIDAPPIDFENRHKDLELLCSEVR